MVKYIVFDLGNVILPFDDNFVANRLSKISGILQKDIQSFLINSPLEKSFDRGEITPLQFYSKLVEKFPIKIEYQEFADLWNGIFSLNYETVTIIDILLKKYSLGLLSNTNKLHFEYAFKNFDILKRFHNYFLSYQIGYLKPAPEIFYKVIDTYRCKPEEIIFIDDIANNIFAAKALGIQAVHFKNIMQLKDDFIKAGIKI